MSEFRSGARVDGEADGAPPLQIAALVRRDGPAGPEVLLVTSRGTGRWILPKGWPEPELDGPGVARLEAWEEAGLTGAAARPQPAGEYEGLKRHDSGAEQAVRVRVFELEGGRLAADWPEAAQRRRAWVSVDAAAEMVDEPGLSAFLAGLRPRSG
jgi:8-oxo-dGTP pyrophosphatase MutT (NUDIX family)